MLYAVGMVMRHFSLNYICVIYDWDVTCKASKEWQVQMGIHELRDKDDQPFYNVLVEDGSHRYVAQGTLSTMNLTSKPINILLFLPDNSKSPYNDL